VIPASIFMNRVAASDMSSDASVTLPAIALLALPICCCACSAAAQDWGRLRGAARRSGGAAFPT
jgi:hypothetical protein